MYFGNFYSNETFVSVIEWNVEILISALKKCYIKMLYYLKSFICKVID